MSAVIAELAADAALLEGMHELVEHLGGPALTDADREKLEREWARPAPRTAKRAAGRKRKARA